MVQFLKRFMISCTNPTALVNGPHTLFILRIATPLVMR